MPFNPFPPFPAHSSPRGLRKLLPPDQSNRNGINQKQPETINVKAPKSRSRLLYSLGLFPRFHQPCPVKFEDLPPDIYSPPSPEPYLAFRGGQTMNESRILDAIDARRDELVGLAQTLLRRPSENPPGGEREVAEALKQVMEQLLAGRHDNHCLRPRAAQRDHYR